MFTLPTLFFKLKRSVLSLNLRGMKTEILQDFDLLPAIRALKSGELVAFPTETVYGLGAPVFNEEAVQKIFTVKGRPADNPLIAHIASLDEASRLGEGFNAFFYMLAEAFWPGPLTIVVQKRACVPDLVSAGHPTIAIRMPMHRVARELIIGVGEPLVAPSANLSGKPSPTRVRDVWDDLNGKIGYIIDGGECEVGLESTVISLVHAQPTLLRPGKVTQEALEEILGEKVVLPEKGAPILSPGMKYRHYAPLAKMKLVFKKEELQGPFFKPTQQSLYKELRNADRQHLEFIEIYCDEAVQKDPALMNRLLRASGEIWIDNP